MRRRIISIAGSSRTKRDSYEYQLAFEVGKAIIDNGYRLQTGGLAGIMEAASKGARSSEKYREGDIIGILPGFDANVCNEYVDIAIPTGIDIYRNIIIANASAVIVISGGSGTLTEIGNAWALKKLIVGMEGTKGWSSKLAGKRVDDRERYPNIPEDQVYPAKTAEEALAIINKYIDLYQDAHVPIHFELKKGK